MLLRLDMSHDLSCDLQPATEEGEHFYPSVWLGFNVPSDKGDISKRFQVFSTQVSDVKQ